jgi:hypothetical protein
MLIENNDLKTPAVIKKHETKSLSQGMKLKTLGKGKCPVDPL